MFAPRAAKKHEDIYRPKAREPKCKYGQGNCPLPVVSKKGYCPKHDETLQQPLPDKVTGLQIRITHVRVLPTITYFVLESIAQPSGIKGAAAVAYPEFSVLADEVSAALQAVRRPMPPFPHTSLGFAAEELTEHLQLEFLQTRTFLLEDWLKNLGQMEELWSNQLFLRFLGFHTRLSAKPQPLALKKWTCTTCTYSNSASNAACKFCLTPKNGSSGSGSLASAAAAATANSEHKSQRVSHPNARASSIDLNAQSKRTPSWEIHGKNDVVRKNCSVPQCNRPRTKRGYCAQHLAAVEAGNMVQTPPAADGGDFSSLSSVAVQQQQQQQQHHLLPPQPQAAQPDTPRRGNLLDKVKTAVHRKPSKGSESNKPVVDPPPSAPAAPALSKEVDKSHFNIYNNIGTGGFAAVYVGTYKSTGVPVAVKVMSKSVIANSKRHLKLMWHEWAVLKCVGGSDFLCELKHAFQDETQLYLVMPFYPGGDLRMQLHRTKGISEQAVQFYCSQIVMGLEALHSRQIMYRDMKPANLLLDSEGNIALSDFGISVQVKGPGSTTKGNPGTPGYRAPEVLAHQRYSVSCDWWSFGITVYVMTFGKKLFEREHEKALAAAALNQDDSAIAEVEEFIKEGIEGVSDAHRQFMLDLLTVDWRQRLGTCPEGTFHHTAGLQTVKAHPFFKGLDWNRVANRSYPPPMRPKLTKIKKDLVHPSGDPVGAEDQRAFIGFEYRTGPHNGLTTE